MFWVAMALLVSVTNEYPWVENFKMFVLILAVVVSFGTVFGINNFMSKKFVYYKLLRHRIVLQFEHRPPARFCGCTLPSWAPAKFFDVASMALVVLTLGTFILGLAIFYYSHTGGYEGGFYRIQFAKLGGTIGGGLAASMCSSLGFTTALRQLSRLVSFVSSVTQLLLTAQSHCTQLPVKEHAVAQDYAVHSISFV